MRIFTESGRELTPKDPHIKRVFSLGFPIEYNLDSWLLERLQTNEDRRFCIDFAGRNHGVDESVYVDADELVAFLKEEGII